MQNRKGLSDVITTVLIILLTLAAIILIWTFIRPVISNAGQSVNVQGVCLQLQIEPTSCLANTPIDGLADVKFKYAAGDLDTGVSFNKVKIILTYPDKSTSTNDTSTSIAKFASDEAADVGKTETVNPETFSLAPVLTIGGKEYTCGESVVKVACS